MAHIYLDTSVLIALVCPEAATAQALAWLRASAGDTLASTPWILTETASALAIKGRAGRLDAHGLAAASQASRRVLSMLRIEPLVSEDFERAAELCAQPQSRLRGGDALHLAAAQRLGCTALATLDKLMGSAAVALGLTPVFSSYQE